MSVDKFIFAYLLQALSTEYLDVNSKFIFRVGTVDNFNATFVALFLALSIAWT